MFATVIVNVCIIQPHDSVVHWVLKVGDVKCTNQRAKDLVYERRTSVAKTGTWVVTKQLCKFA